MRHADHTGAHRRRLSSTPICNTHSCVSSYGIGDGDTRRTLGLEFFNMGMMVLNTAVMKPFLRGQTPESSSSAPSSKICLDGVGVYKWSTDQTLLNYWLKKDRIPVKHLDWKYNGLYGSLWGDNIEKCDFVHFYLKDKLPENGENVDALMEKINV